MLLSLIPLKLTHMGRMKGKSLLVSGQSRRLGRDLEIFFAKRVESVRFESFSAEVAFSMFSVLIFLSISLNKMRRQQTMIMSVK